MLMLGEQRYALVHRGGALTIRFGSLIPFLLGYKKVIWISRSSEFRFD